MDTFSAAYIEVCGQAVILDSQVEAPELLPYQVNVKIAYSGVCHSQLMEVRGLRGEDRYLPHMIGHEATGVVKSVGPGVTKVAPGDRVVLTWIKAEGTDAPGAVYRSGNKKINAGRVTTFMEYAVVSESRLVKLPDAIPMDVGVLFGCAIPTGAGIVLNTIRPGKGSTLGVWGLGGIGLSAVMASQVFECEKVIAIDVEEEKLALAKKFGATHTVNSRSQDAVAEIRQLTRGTGLDYCVEAAGLCQTIELAFDSVKAGGGLVVFASHPKHGEKIKLDPFDFIRGKRILGTWGGECQPDRDIQNFAKLYAAGKLPLNDLISRRYPLDGINRALDDLESRRVARPLLVIDASLG